VWLVDVEKWYLTEINAENNIQISVFGFTNTDVDG
jgi:hypothetical protein